MTRVAFLVLPALATLGCAEPASDDGTCGELPELGCEATECDPSFGAERECAAGSDLYECTDGAWAEVGTCMPDLLVVDGPWTIEHAGVLDGGCPVVTLPERTLAAEHPEGTQQLTLTEDGSTFTEVSLLIAFDRGHASFGYAGTWSGVTVTGEYMLELAHTGDIAGTAWLSLDDGASACTVELDVTGTFDPGTYQW